MSQSDYIAQLNPLEQKVLHIAIEHLETSFSLSKSIGFQEWQAQAQQAQAQQAQAQAQAAAPAQQAAPAPTKAPPLLVKRKIRIKSKTP
jgi:biotin carboxyl carrier protein